MQNESLMAASIRVAVDRLNDGRVYQAKHVLNNLLKVLPAPGPTLLEEAEDEAKQVSIKRKA